MVNQTCEMMTYEDLRTQLLPREKFNCRIEIQNRNQSENLDISMSDISTELDCRRPAGSYIAENASVNVS